MTDHSIYYTAQILLQVQSFFSGVDVGPGKRSLAQALETIRLHIQWHENNLGDLTQWLNQHLANVTRETSLEI